MLTNSIGLMVLLTILFPARTPFESLRGWVGQQTMSETKGLRQLFHFCFVPHCRRLDGQGVVAKTFDLRKVFQWCYRAYAVEY